METVTAAAEELMRRIHDYVSRVMHDPTLIQKNRGEFQAVVNAWKILNKMLPGVLITPEEFQKILINQAKAAFHERMDIVATSLSEPRFPGPNATEAELAKFQKDLGKYNRMFEMYSKIMANSHEMKKALIGNLPR